MWVSKLSLNIDYVYLRMGVRLCVSHTYVSACQYVYYLHMFLQKTVRDFPEQIARTIGTMRGNCLYPTAERQVDRVAAMLPASLLATH